MITLYPSVTWGKAEKKKSMEIIRKNKYTRMGKTFWFEADMDVTPYIYQHDGISGSRKRWTISLAIKTRNESSNILLRQPTMYRETKPILINNHSNLVES